MLCVFSCRFRLFALLLALLPTTYAQQGAVEINSQSPEIRRIIALIQKLNASPKEATLQSVENFDIAWQLAVSGEDLPAEEGISRATAGLALNSHYNNIGARIQLKRIFANRSDEFRQRYEQTIGPAARKALQKTLAREQISDVERLISRYQFTKSGQSALKTLVQLYVSQGNSIQAALSYRRLLDLTNDQNSERWLRLSGMLWNAGMDIDAIHVLQKASQFDDATQKIVPQITTSAAARKWLSKKFSPNTEAKAAIVWSQPGGNLRRAAIQQAGPPELSMLWAADAFACLECVDCIDPDELNILLTNLRDFVSADVRFGLQNDVVRWPAALPLIAEDFVVFRGPAKIRCVRRSTGKIAWETTLIDPQLNAALEEWRTASNAQQALLSIQLRLREDLLTQQTQVNLAGQMATDGRLLFAIEESSRETMYDLDDRAPKSASATNYLRAYDLESGILRGEAGGAVGAEVAGGSNNPLAGMYFLGAPLILGDQIFVLAESDQGIFVLKLKAIPLYDSAGQVDLRPVASQLLISPEVDLRNHPVRKLAGLTPAYHNGLLICPTGDEMIFAVSADDLSMQWAYRYETSVGRPELEMGIGRFRFNSRDRTTLVSDSEFRWTDSLVRVVGDRVYVTPRDSHHMFCLEAQTGKLLWDQLRGPYRCMRIIDDQVLLIGLHRMAALDSATGKFNWQTVLEQEVVAGTPVYSAECVQVPTANNEVITFSLKTGQRLLQQAVPEGAVGNLLSDGNHLFVQTSTNLVALGINNEAPSPLNGIRRQLLAGSVVDILPDLEKLRTTTTGDDQEEVTRLYLDTALNRIADDFTSNAELLAKVTNILDTSTYSPSSAREILLESLGTTMLDAYVLPEIVSRTDITNSYRQRLNKIVVGQLEIDFTQSTQEIVSQLFAAVALAEKFADTFLQVGDTSIIGDRLRLRSVQQTLRRLPASNAEAIATAFVARLQDHANSLAPDRQIWWHQIPLHLGLASFTAQGPILNSELPRSQAESLVEQLLHQRSLVAAMTQRGTKAEPLTKALIADTRTFLQQTSPLTLSAVEQKTEIWFNSSFQVMTRDTPAHSVAEHGIYPARPLNPLPNLEENASRFVGTPEVNETLLDIGGDLVRTTSQMAPQQVLPIFGQQGLFADWNLLLSQNSTTVQAFDGQGRERWTMDLTQFDTATDRPQLYQLKDLYAVVFGHLMALKRGKDILLLDCRRANKTTPPELLWRRNLKDEFPEMPDAQRRPPYWQNVFQFDLRPAGLFPMGPLSQHGLPVLVGRRLVIFETLTGKAVSRIDGLSPETTITSDALFLLLISPRNNNVEVRRLLDGTLLRVVNLPTWWAEAEDNQGESVQTVQLSAGETDRYRLDVRGGRATFLNRTTTGCSVSQLNLASGLLNFDYRLPVDTVASNVIDGHVALLSKGTELQVLNLVTGRIVCRTETQTDNRCMYLFLKSSPEHWLVTTSVFGDQYDNLNPIRSSFIANGKIFGINRSTGQVDWKRDATYQHIRGLRPERSVHPSFAPLLVLHTRPEGPPKPGRVRGRVFYQSEIVDTRTGKTLHTADDVGSNLSYHAMLPNADDRKLSVSYNDRIIEFQYE